MDYKPFDLLTPPVETCIVTPSLSSTISRLESLGIGPFKRYLFSQSSVSNVRYRGQQADIGIKVAFANQGSMVWEVMEPVSGPTPMAGFLEQNGNNEGIQHVAFDFKEGWHSGKEFGQLEERGETDEEKEAWREAQRRIKEFDGRGWDCVLHGTWHGKRGTCNFCFFEMRIVDGVTVSENQRPKTGGICVETIVWSRDWEDPDEDNI